MQHPLARAAWLPVLSAMLMPSGAIASTPPAVVPNFATPGEAVVCGVAEEIEGTAFDPGTGAQLTGPWPGLQCQAEGLPHVQGIGDPAVQLGQGRAGRARLVDISQDDLASDTPYMPLQAGSLWKRNGIACTVGASTVRCTNAPGYGFTLEPGHVHVFSPAAAPKACGSVSYTSPHTNGHGHAALNDITAASVSCATARSVASVYLATAKPPTGWHAASRMVAGHSDGRAIMIGEEIFTRGAERISGELAN